MKILWVPLFFMCLMSSPFASEPDPSGNWKKKLVCKDDALIRDYWNRIEVSPARDADGLERDVLFSIDLGTNEEVFRASHCTIDREKNRKRRRPEATMNCVSDDQMVEIDIDTTKSYPNFWGRGNYYSATLYVSPRMTSLGGEFVMNCKVQE